MADLRPPHPLPAGWTATFLGAGLAIGAFSTWVAYKYIEAYVWEDYASAPRIFQLWLTFFLCALLVVTVVREQIVSALAPGQAPEPAPELARDSPIRETLYAGRLSDAVRQYGETSGLDTAAARRVVRQMAARLYRDEPGRFSRHPMLPPPVVPRRLAAGALVIGLASAVGLRLFAPEAMRGPWSILFLGGAAVGVVLAFIRTTFSRWRRVLLILSAMVLQGAAVGMVVAHDSEAMALTPMLLGIAAGLGLIVSARGRC
jgi:hypothetical protein